MSTPEQTQRERSRSRARDIVESAHELASGETPILLAKAGSSTRHYRTRGAEPSDEIDHWSRNPFQAPLGINPEHAEEEQIQMAAIPHPENESADPNEKELKEIAFAVNSTHALQDIMQGGMYVKQRTAEYVCQLSFPAWQVPPEAMPFSASPPQQGAKQSVLRELMAITLIDYVKPDGTIATKIREIERSRVICGAPGRSNLLSQPDQVAYRQKEWDAEKTTPNGEKWLLLDLVIQDAYNAMEGIIPEQAKAMGATDDLPIRPQLVHLAKLVQEKWTQVKSLKVKGETEEDGNQPTTTKQFTYSTNPPFTIPHKPENPSNWEGYEIRFLRKSYESPKPLPLPMSLNPAAGLPSCNTWYICVPGALPYRAPSEAFPPPNNLTPPPAHVDAISSPVTEDIWRIASPSPWTATSDIILRTPVSRNKIPSTPVTAEAAASSDQPPTQDYSGRHATSEEDLFETQS